MTNLTSFQWTRRNVIYIVGGIAVSWLVAGYLPGIYIWLREGGRPTLAGLYSADASPTARHTYLHNGLLKVNPEAPHPIYELIDRAEILWNAKHARQAKTLKDAVDVYKERYRRYPPPGFDKWWAYCEEHNVQLRDEYDQIFWDLQPFWGYDPSYLKEKREEWLKRKDVVETYIVGKKAGDEKVTVLQKNWNKGRAFEEHIEMQMEFFKDIEQWLPPFEASISPHDNPTQLADYEWRKATMVAATLKKPLKEEDHVIASPIAGWKAACPPYTPYRKSATTNPNPQRYYTENETHHLIFDPTINRDPCLFPPPSHLGIHGLFAAYPGPGLTALTEIVPVLSVCTSGVHGDIVVANPYLWKEDVVDQPFMSKTRNALLWRGSNTGAFFSNDNPGLLSHTQRTRLVNFGNNHEGTVAIINPLNSPNASASTLYELSKINTNGTIDISFSGKPIQCEDPTCATLQQTFPWAPFMSDEEQYDYRYVIDVDGNGSSGRFKRLMTSHQLVFKSTIFTEWFVDRIAPWVHYVPIQLDYSDLYDSLTFFRGDPYNGTGGHSELAERIAHAGREWAKTYFRKEDMKAYMFRLYLEYARVMSLNRDELEFRLE